MRTPLFLGVGLLLAITVPAQDKPQFKARELFYTPITEATPTQPATKEPAKAASAKPVKPKQTRPTKIAEEAATQAPKTTPATLPDGTRLQNTTTIAGDVVGPPLALKYRLLKRTLEGRYDEVDTDTVFRSGDKIRVSVESNDNGYLYIVQQGSSKTWNLLFPNEETESGSNRIQRNQEYDLPGGGRFTFDEQPGAERLFIVLTRRPEPDLEKLIYALSQDGAAKPASTSNSQEKPKMMIAQHHIDDALIDGLRGRVLARDLVFEKVNDDAPVSTSSGSRREKALYVATPDRTAAARVVVDLTLKHQ
jgi:Domain of unknown function (DUF4384)